MTKFHPFLTAFLFFFVLFCFFFVFFFVFFFFFFLVACNPQFVSNLVTVMFKAICIKL